MYVEPPQEWKDDHPDEDYVWQLVKQLYGRRPAPRAFSDFVAGVLIDKIGMKRCVEVPHLYYHEETSKGRDTPITKPVVGSEEDMSTDRPDIQYTVNELSSLMSRPTQRGWESAKHLVRYLLKTKDYALFFGREAENCDDVVTMTDSDWATDQSKSAVHIYVGDCLLYSYTRRQTVIAQSSAEAEFYATASGVSEGILLRKVLAFFGLPLGLRALTDIAANNAMAHRLVGKVRHLETKVLWLQQLVYRGLLTMTWRAGRFNNSDLGTKVLQKARFQELVEKVGLRDRAEDVVGVQQVAKVRSGPTREQIAQAIVMLAGFSQVQPVTGQLTKEALEVPEADEFPLILLLVVPFLIGMLVGCLGLWIWWRCQRARSEPVIFYKVPAGIVLHLDKKCHYLKKTEKLDEWFLCQWCGKQKLKLD